MLEVLIKYDVFVTISRTKRVEMDVKGIEMS